MSTLGIDPTSTGAMGWALIDQGQVLQFGQVNVKQASELPEIDRLNLQGRALADLLREWDCELVVIERAIINSRVVAQYAGDAANTAKITGSVSSSISIGIAAGWLACTVVNAGREARFLNPGAAKYFATGSAHAHKNMVRDAARLRIYECAYQEATRRGQRAPNQDTIKRPSEHIAAAIFIALAGEHYHRMERISAK